MKERPTLGRLETVYSLGANEIVAELKTRPGGPTRKTIAEVHFFDGTVPTEAERDLFSSYAKLFAAAPLLLSEMRDFHDHTIDMGWHDCDSFHGECPVAIAIAAAEGEP